MPRRQCLHLGAFRDGRSIGHNSDGLFGDDRGLRLQQSQKVLGQFSSPAHARVTKSDLDLRLPLADAES